MTAIVGLVDADGNIYMGGDSAGTFKSGEQNLMSIKKVFNIGSGFLIGVCGSVRLLQVLKYNFLPPIPPKSKEGFEEYLVTVFADALMVCFTGSGLYEEWGEGMAGAIAIGYQGQLATVRDNLQMEMVRDNYIAIGSGMDVSLGAFYATEDKEPLERVRLALKATAKYSSTVREPFDVIRMDFDPDWLDSKPVKKKKRATAKK